ncbi:hypothetical protein [Fulvimarina sp. MAC3]|uniref:hypothetical protein n=1 Tax=Fulvimarina sp. MAC3 TaxID=3148887 RepID=UPI0031FD544E
MKKLRTVAARLIAAGTLATTGVLSAIDAQAQDADETTYLPYDGTMAWDESSFGKTFEGDDWRVTLRKMGTNETSRSVADISREGGPSQLFDLFDGEYNPRGEIGLQPLTSDGQTLFLTYYSGGAHCCTSIVFFRERGGEIEKLDFGDYDGGGALFEDIDGDGTREIITVDQRFLYFFDSYAASLAPTRIHKLEPDGLQDVTDVQWYRPYLRKEYINDLNRLMNSQSNGDFDGSLPQGLVAGLIAEGAQLGVWRATAAMMPQDVLSGVREDWSLTCPSDVCSEEREFSTLNEALDTILPAWGYPREEPLPQDVQAYFAPLFGSRFGSVHENSELGCDLGPIAFSEGPDGANVAYSAYESACTFDKGSVGETTSMVEGLCSGEGMSWFGWFVFEHSGDTLRRTDWSSDPAQALTSPRLSEFRRCPKN